MASKERDKLNDDFEPEEFSLEDILAEYGGGRKQAILRDVETVVKSEIGRASCRERV